MTQLELPFDFEPTTQNKADAFLTAFPDIIGLVPINNDTTYFPAIDAELTFDNDALYVYPELAEKSYRFGFYDSDNVGIMLITYEQFDETNDWQIIQSLELSSHLNQLFSFVLTTGVTPCE